jgi:hypothetical protein
MPHIPSLVMLESLWVAQVRLNVHSFMKDSDNFDFRRSYISVKNQVACNGIFAIASFYKITVGANIGSVGKQMESIIELPQINSTLFFTPLSLGIDGYRFQIRFGLVGEPECSH